MARIAAGARRGAECRLGPTSDALLAVNLLVRAGERDAEEVLAALPGLPALADVIPSWYEDDDENEAVDEDALEAEVEELLAALDAWCEDRNAAADWQSLVTFAGGSMAEFRLSYCATGPADWNAGDLHEYLLDYVPRKVTIAEEDIERFPLGVAEVLHFLGETGRLDAHEASDLAGRAAACAARFTAAARDRSNYGPAKALVTAMLADGVDLHDQHQVDSWIATYNALPLGERRARTSSPPTATSVKKRAKTRKAQRQARRRHRGRR